MVIVKSLNIKISGYRYHFEVFNLEICIIKKENILSFLCSSIKRVIIYNYAKGFLMSSVMVHVFNSTWKIYDGKEKKFFIELKQNMK